ncbi:hypothetical protein AAC387_Pa10g1646 [Persea americana]
MDSIDQLIACTGFGVAHSGEPPDGTYIMAQCFGDLLPDDCSACHAAIGKHLLGRFPAIGGRDYLEGCFVRAENYSFFHEISTKEDKRTQIKDVSSCLPATEGRAVYAGFFIWYSDYQFINFELIINDTVPSNKRKAMDSFLIERNLHFKYSTLEKATNFFDDSNKLGQGGFGEVYKGPLQMDERLQ